MKTAPSSLVLVLLLLSVAGCKSAYYGTRAMFGAEKRDILVERVKDARDDQAAAGKQFQTTLERFQEITNFQGGELEAKYKRFSKEYENAKGAADDVKARIAKVEEVAKDLFSEWKTELKQYSDPKLRSSSEQKLRETQNRYEQLIDAMKTSAGKMDPVLKVFNDQVLYLKHQLNAAAISSLSGTAAQIETDVQALIRDLQKSIAEADAFINTMK
jgi:hypothetical protein